MLLTLNMVTGKVQRQGKIENWPRKSKPVSSLVKKALEVMGY